MFTNGEMKIGEVDYTVAVSGTGKSLREQKMNNENYTLRIDFNFDALDDVEARKIARQNIEKVEALINPVRCKLQKLKENSEPVGVKI